MDFPKIKERPYQPKKSSALGIMISWFLGGIAGIAAGLFILDRVFNKDVGEILRIFGL